MCACSCLARLQALAPSYEHVMSLLKDGSELQAYQSYSAVSIKSSILELTSSKILFSAVFLLLRNSSVAFNTIGPPADVDERAAIKSCSSSWQAVSKCSRLIRIWTI